MWQSANLNLMIPNFQLRVKGFLGFLWIGLGGMRPSQGWQYCQIELSPRVTWSTRPHDPLTTGIQRWAVVSRWNAGPRPSLMLDCRLRLRPLSALFAMAEAIMKCKSTRVPGKASDAGICLLSIPFGICVERLDSSYQRFAAVECSQAGAKVTKLSFIGMGLCQEPGQEWNRRTGRGLPFLFKSGRDRAV